ncbi:hypothetical protein ACFL3T_04160 [Patescibacteria group bacterium]
MAVDRKDDDMMEFCEDLALTVGEICDRHEAAGAVVHRADPNLASDLMAKIATSPKAFFFEMQTHASRALKAGDIPRAIRSLEGALGLADRHPEVEEMGDLVAAVSMMKEALETGEAAAVFAVEAQLKATEELITEAMRG